MSLSKSRQFVPLHVNSSVSIPNYNETLSRSPPKFYSNMMTAPANTNLLTQMINSKHNDVLRPTAYTFRPTAQIKSILSIQAKAYRLNLANEQLSPQQVGSYSALQRGHATLTSSIVRGSTMVQTSKNFFNTQRTTDLRASMKPGLLTSPTSAV